jgi:hypothetical protein
MKRKKVEEKIDVNQKGARRENRHMKKVKQGRGRRNRK